MTRTKPAGLSESWDNVEEEEQYQQQDEPQIYDEPSDLSDDDAYEEERITRSTRSVRSNDRARKTTRFRDVLNDGEPRFVMPASPDGGSGRRSVQSTGNKLRASTPHFRLNERSLTSDAGKHNQMRASTPHFRLNERSLTSDAGLFKREGPRSSRRNEDDNNEQISEVQKAVAELPNTVFSRVLQPSVSYCWDIVGLAFSNLKPFLGYFLLAYILIGGVIFGTGFVNNSINSALTPLCRIPGAGLFNLPFCKTYGSDGVEGPAEFDKLVQVQSAFDEVLSSTSVGSTLPLDMKRSEASIRDLKHVVQYSHLPSRNELVFEFGGFVDTARQASQDLSRFNTRIGRAVDHILSTNRWTLSVIEGVNSVEESRGSVARWVSHNLNIFAPFQPVAMSRDVLLDQYLRHTGAVEEQILTLISEAQSLLSILDNLDGRLDVIASIATRDGVKVEGNKEELFAALWTKLGGNRNSVQKLEQQIALLKQVGAYRRLAWAHITSTVVKLQAIRDNLEDLRERVALPEVVGTDRVPLEVHINSINLGIERLETQRENSRRIEADGHARILSRAEAGNKKLVGGKSEL